MTAPAAWSVASKFHGEWHPFIDWMKPESATVRCFKVKGENRLYRERLTYFSDSDKTLRYEMIEGIEGALSYRASIQVTAAGAAVAGIRWSAEIDAPEPRASEIAKGTEHVFLAGIDALAKAQIEVPIHRPRNSSSLLLLQDKRIAASPSLALTCDLNKEGPLLLFLHGIGGNRGNWRAQQETLESLVQTAALDLRGYGQSALGAEQSRVEDHCGDILRIMATLKKEKVILCGLSFGSWIATSFAMRHRDKLAGLVLSGGCTGMSEAREEERNAFLESRDKPLREGKTPADFAPQVVEAIAGPEADERMRRILHDSMAAIPAATYRDALFCFTHPKEQFDFARIECPVLLMTGEHDRLASPPEIRATAQRIHDRSRKPDVRFETIERAGHVCNIENPVRYNALLSEFVRRLV